VTLAFEKDILRLNNKLAEENRKLLRKKSIKTYDILGSIGSGKTTLIQKLALRLRKKGFIVGAIAGDVSGDDDYKKFKKCNLFATNINTGKECHLDARLVAKALKKLPLQKIDILFIENVGNLVCPLDFPVGAEKRFVVISTTEGEDTIRKHPLIFAKCELTILNKIDLASFVAVKLEKLVKDFERINPHGKLILTNARRGVGIKSLLLEVLP
jgi:hydrogenase nickel incorporation protein HypB